LTAHNLRSDALREGTITAIDVIMSLGDQRENECGLQWCESIGSARPVKSYWVEAINGDKSYLSRAHPEEEIRLVILLAALALVLLAKQQTTAFVFMMGWLV
jgi:hypothetical protein